jgi:hypothetical protein
MQCPVCGAQAENTTPAGFDGIGVGCPRCGKYQVAGSVLNMLLRRDVDARAEALKKAQKFAPPATTPVINTTCL